MSSFAVTGVTEINTLYILTLNINFDFSEYMFKYYQIISITTREIFFHVKQ